MKCFVDISIKHSGGIRKGNGEGVVTIWTIVNGQRKESGPYTVSVEDESINALAIRSVNEAMKHFTKPGQEIEIRMEVPYVRAKVQYLEEWHKRDYRTSKGKVVANEEQWRLLWMHMQNHRISFPDHYEAL